MPRPLLPFVALLASIAAIGPATAQLSPPNATGVAMGHLHYVVRDVAAKAFWVALGGRAISREGTIEGVSLPDVVVLLRQGESSGGTDAFAARHNRKLSRRSSRITST